jgi:hypothetical protein
MKSQKSKPKGGRKELFSNKEKKAGSQGEETRKIFK